MNSGWQVRQDCDGVPHVVPVEDLAEHLPVDCWCHPKHEDGVVIHAAFDEREKFERGERKTS